MNSSNRLHSHLCESINGLHFYIFQQLWSKWAPPALYPSAYLPAACILLMVMGGCYWFLITCHLFFQAFYLTLMYIFYCSKIYTTWNSLFWLFLRAQFTGIKHIHVVVQPSPPSSPRTSSSSRTGAAPVGTPPPLPLPQSLAPTVLAPLYFWIILKNALPTPYQHPPTFYLGWFLD